MNRNGFTLIELIVVIAIIMVLAALILPAIGIFGTNSSFEGYVTDKWTDIDGEGNSVYRCRTQSSTGEINTWNTFWIHNEISVGGYYKLTSKSNLLTKAESTPSPIPIPIPIESERTNGNP